MQEPVPELDQRFSDPKATAWSEVQRGLEAAQLFWITTVRTDGRPHVTPLVAVWLDDALYFNTGDGEQKGVNLRRNRHVVLVTGCNHWEAGRDIVLEGDAVQVTDHDLLARLAAAWTTKWRGQWQYEVRDGSFCHEGGGAALVFGVRPHKVLAFAKGTFGQTRYRF
jgi:general stress protein 26